MTIIFLSLFLAFSGAAEVCAAQEMSSAGVTLKVAYTNIDGVLVDENGNHDGYAVKYLEEIARYTGWEYEFVYSPWEGAVDGLNSGAVDLLIMVHHTEEREREYLFSALPMADDTLVFCVNSDSDVFYQEYEAFDGMRIGVESGTVYEEETYDHILELGMECRVISYPSFQELQKALKAGEIDMITTSGFGYYSDLKIVDRFSTDPVYFAMAKDNARRMDELDDAMQKVRAHNRELESQLMMTYYNLSTDIRNLYLTREEQMYLDTVESVVIKTHAGHKPMAYVNEDGSVQGILMDYLDALGAMVDLEFVYESLESTNTEDLAATMAEEDFCVSLMGQGQFGSSAVQEANNIYMSGRVFDSALAYVKRSGEAVEKYEDHTFAMNHEMGYLEELFLETNPNSKIIYYDTAMECMEALLDGEAEMAILEEHEAAYLMQKPVFSANLEQVPGSGAYMSEIHIYTPEQHKYLISILNKVNDHLSEKQRQYMVSNAKLSYAYESQLDDMFYEYGKYIILLAIAVVIICGMGLVLYIRRDRFKKQKKETEELQKRLEKDRYMNRALEDALNTANAANDSKRNFLANMSHDIRTPMNAIMGFSSLMSQEAEDPDKVREYARRISISSQHLMGLVNDILDMSKIESGKTSLNYLEFSLPQMLEEITAMLAPEAKKKEQDFEVRTKGVLPEYLLGDKIRLQQILTNLLTNALKYTSEGGQIRMSVEAIASVKQKQTHLRFTVEDNGCGMSQEFLKHIFDPFARERKMHANEVQGTGLGMPITNALVKLMGGTISIESTENVGSTFTVDLMFTLADHAQDLGFWKRSGIRRVLVIDDEEDVCTDIQLILKGVGVEVDYATDGARGIEMLVQAHEYGKDYSVVLVDWKMPGIDGEETARVLRQKIGPELPIFMITAYAADEVETIAKSAGVSSLLPKPFFLSYFQLALEELFGRKNMEESEESQEKSVAGMRVLAAEDHEFNADLLLELLKLYDVSCDMASNGQEALDYFLASEAGYYDIVLMDVQMPVMDGHEAARRIRNSDHPDAASIPIIAMTANAFEDDVKASLAAGMTTHAAKPIGKEKLKRLLQRYGS